jgi:exopolysaccharide production protein ExoQ
MNYANHPHPASALHGERSPWLIFLFLAFVFFLVYHDLSYSKKTIDDLRASEDQFATVVAEGSIVRRVALLSLGLFAIVSLVRHRADGRIRLYRPLGWILVSFAAWALLSLTWAEDFSLSLRRLVVFAIVCLAAAAIARRFSFREIVLWTVSSSTLFLVIGVLAEVFLGTFRPFASDYRFAGTVPPNSQGISCALLVLSGLAAADLEKRRRITFRACALLGFVFLILTASRTSIAVCLLTLVIYLGAVSSRALRIAMTYSFCIALCFSLLILGNTFLPKLQSAVIAGRDISTVGTFNGRTGIWDDVTYYIRQRPIIGYGYGGFWTPAHLKEISEEENWAVPDGHSAYLDYLLALGAVGLSIYVLLLLVGIMRAFCFYRSSRNSTFAFCGAMLMFCALDGFLESAMVYPSALMFLSMVVLTRLAFIRRSDATGAVIR